MSAPKGSGGGRGATFSVIGADVTITGDIAASVDLHIDGRVDGDIACASLVQGAESRIKGHVDAQSATLAGHVEGSITAQTLVIEHSARITGDVTYESISIAPGGQVDGRFTHKGGVQTGELKLISG
ncbi:bactofilin family protein [Sphingobium subterraneum]|uniref:Cytoskeletal protein CcmA (Bactofilin family) n=1 Tax=Sphingobium subterraneum TaxID=627688 RepID=A0A841J2N3_9SPHN|nr:polymer-forming cytoskeletal protein [Sphingobium subterraneum]MBB6124984.1 cytoskeletal protein CcmA (bactofilin family) [Sphingobium subterraneum]